MSIAVISSLYRCEAHLPAFAAAVFGFAKQVSASGIAVHYLPIVNDATAAERAQIDRLAEAINGHYYGRMTAQYVPRESLYASWNRGIALTDAPYFAPWNADDFRSAAAFIEGYRQLQEGSELVDFPFTRVYQYKRFSLWPRERRLSVPPPFEQTGFTRRNGLGPFFMARKALCQRVGFFDAHFRVAGDSEWASRLLGRVRFVPGNLSGGDFIIHGQNLSNTGGEREDIEVNIIFLRRGDWQQLRPANPPAMRAAWQDWGKSSGQSLPAEVADFLWGAGALRRWKRYQRERRQPPALRRLRLALAARGLIHSVEWSLWQQERKDS